MKLLGLPLTLVCTVVVLTGCGSSGTRLNTFAGGWVGHDRSLSITPTGRGAERINSGCCYRAVTLHFRVTRVWGTTHHPSARAVVTYVHVYTPSAFTRKYPPPYVGQVGTLRIVKGVLHEPLGGASYCNGKTPTAPYPTAPCGA